MALPATGERVWVGPVHERDIAPYRRALEQSRTRVARWNPVDPDDLARALTAESPTRRTFLVHALTPEGDHDIVGKINISDVVRGRFESAAMGYDAYDPYAGRGLFAEGLRLLLDLLFTAEGAGGLGLHRVQAAVQPGNVRSAGLLRSLGFQRESCSPRMLWVPGADGREAWQDHDSYVVLRDEWPARPYPLPRGRRVVALVNLAPGSGTTTLPRGSGSTTLARQLAAELRVPLFDTGLVFDGTGPVWDTGLAGSPDAVWALLADSPVGAVVKGAFRPQDAALVAAGLRGSGHDPSAVAEVWCSSGLLRSSAGPLGLGPLVIVDTDKVLERRDVVRIALQVALRRSFGGPGAVEDRRVSPPSET